MIPIDFKSNGIRQSFKESLNISNNKSLLK